MADRANRDATWSDGEFCFAGALLAQHFAHEMERALIESDGEEILPHHLHFFKEAPAAANATVAGATPGFDTDIPLNLDQAERWLIRRALARAGGNISEAARLLGTHRNRIYRALAEQEHAKG